MVLPSGVPFFLKPLVSDLTLGSAKIRHHPISSKKKAKNAYLGLCLCCNVETLICPHSGGDVTGVHVTILVLLYSYKYKANRKLVNNNMYSKI